MKHTIQYVATALFIGTVLSFGSQARALEYHYSADMYDNTFYTPTSDNAALDIDSKNDSGGQTIIVKSPSMGGDGSADVTDAREGCPSISVGNYLDPWGESTEKQIDADTQLNGLEGLSFNRLDQRESNSGGGSGVYGGAHTERSELAYTNGHFGAVSIGNRGIFANVYPEASAASMRKGAGHVSGTSAWNGNVALCGHNRGSWAYFRNLKNVQVGDIITYRTSLGVRTYRVTFAGKILATDTSVLGGTTQNRITLLTCIANQPSYRLCVIGEQTN